MEEVRPASDKNAATALDGYKSPCKEVHTGVSVVVSWPQFGKDSASDANSIATERDPIFNTVYSVRLQSQLLPAA